jgi:hypothetical protein
MRPSDHCTLLTVKLRNSVRSKSFSSAILWSKKFRIFYELSDTYFADYSNYLVFLILTPG